MLGFGLEIKELEKKKRRETTKRREKERKIEGIEQRGLVDAIDAILGTIFDFAGQAAKKKCKERELLKLAYWKINRPK
jgi:hypothetical protein